MPLIECPDCQNQISDSTPACPQCGHPFEPLPVPAKARQFPQSPAPAIPHPLPQTVYVKDTALTRNRGCGDLLLYGFLGVVILIVGGCVIALM